MSYSKCLRLDSTGNLRTHGYCVNEGVSLRLKLLSLFAALLFWTFHIKSHNLKALVILSHYHFSHLLVYMKKIPSVQPSGVFSWEKTPLRLPMQIIWPWPPVGSFSHGVIIVLKTNENVNRLVFVYILLSTCQESTWHWL